jgi:hypothetical protein
MQVKLGGSTAISWPSAASALGRAASSRFFLKAAISRLTRSRFLPDSTVATSRVAQSTWFAGHNASLDQQIGVAAAQKYTSSKLDVRQLPL